MNIKCLLAALTLITLSACTQREEKKVLLKPDNLAWLEEVWFIDSVAVTPTNVAITVNSTAPYFFVATGNYWRDSLAYAKNYETLFLTPTYETVFSDGYRGTIIFTPVTFANQLKGFKIFTEKDARTFGNDVITNYVAFVALSETPVKVGEGDVVMMMVDGEWREANLTPTP